MDNKVLCSACQAKILTQTAARTGGLCMPCYKPTKPPRPNPRPQHYAFAHELLPRLFFQDPTDLIDALTRDGDRVLARLWASVGESSSRPSAAEPSIQRIDAEEAPACEIRTLPRGEACVVITLPTPREMLEAYFVGLLLLPAVKNTQAIGRVYTLELSQDHHGIWRTVLGGWTADRNHIHYGQSHSWRRLRQGPPPTSDEFVTVVAEIELLSRDGRIPSEN